MLATGNSSNRYLGSYENSTLLDAMELAINSFNDESVYGPFLASILGGEMLPPFNFTLFDCTANVSFKDGCGAEIIFDDMEHARREQERLNLRGEARRNEDWELYSKLLDEDAEDCPIQHFKGMRISREISVVEFQRIGLALIYKAEEIARRDDAPSPMKE